MRAFNQKMSFIRIDDKSSGTKNNKIIRISKFCFYRRDEPYNFTPQKSH